MSATPAKSTLPGTLIRLVGAGLLFATGGIHLDLWLTGYRHIATIGVLFILQVVSAFALGLAVIVVPRRIVALLAAGFALSTLAGYILSLWIGLFGFNEIRTTAGIVAGVIEIGAFLALGGWAVFLAPAEARPLPAPVERALRRGPQGLVVLGFLAFLALLIAAVASGPSATSTATASGSNPAAASGASVHIVIKNFAFVPAHPTVKPGERIVVTNEDGVAHTFTAMPGSSPQGSFNSGDIDPGATGTVTAPSTAGSYAFYCSIHPFMTGALTVS
jgi:plastocyanin